MENKLEQLFKKLLELGRKPNGEEYNHVHAEANRIMSDFGTFYRFCNYVEDGSINRCLNLKLREIVSINSGLWQFVCENNLNYSEDDSIYNVWLKHYAEDDHESPYTYVSPVWYIIESALKDESELDSFILYNIKVDEKDNM